MLFEELVEQHRVHLRRSARCRVFLPYRAPQVGVHLFHFLGHEAELRDAFWINLLLVTEGHWFERENTSLALSIGLISSLKRSEEGAVPRRPF